MIIFLTVRYKIDRDNDEFAIFQRWLNTFCFGNRASLFIRVKRSQPSSPRTETELLITAQDIKPAFTNAHINFLARSRKLSRGQPESFAPLATTHFSNVIFIVTCIVALISFLFSSSYYCIYVLFLNKCE